MPRPKAVPKQEKPASSPESKTPQSPWTGRTRGKRVPESVLNDLTGLDDTEDEEYAVAEQEIEFDEPIYKYEVCAYKVNDVEDPVLFYKSPKHNVVFVYIINGTEGHACLDCLIHNKSKKDVECLKYDNGYVFTDPDSLKHCCLNQKEIGLPERIEKVRFGSVDEIFIKSESEECEHIFFLKKMEKRFNIFGCLRCHLKALSPEFRNESSQVLTTVVGVFFMEDPNKLDHICCPKDELSIERIEEIKFVPTKVAQGPKHPTCLYLSKTKPDYIYRWIFKCYKGPVKIYKCMECELIKRKEFPNADKRVQAKLQVPSLMFKDGCFDMDPDAVDHCCVLYEESDLIKYRKLNMLREKTLFKSESVDLLDIPNDSECSQTDNSNSESANPAFMNPPHLRYKSQRFPNFFYDFVRRSKGDKYGATYKCEGCATQRLSLSHSEPVTVLPQVPSIRWKGGFFQTDPDELDHFCQRGQNSDDIDVEMLDAQDFDESRSRQLQLQSTFFPAIIKSQPARKALVYMYESRKVEDAVYEFVYLHENKCHQVFACVGCKDTKLYHMNLGETGPFPAVPNINVIRKNFLSDPDELPHYCLIPGEYERQVAELKGKTKGRPGRKRKAPVEAQEPSTSREEAPLIPKEEKFPAIEGISLHGKHPLYMYHSVKDPGVIWQFSFKSLNQNDVTYKCTKCDAIKRDLIKEDRSQKLIIPTIRIRAGQFLTDPDDLAHFCIKKSKDTKEETLVKQIVLKISKEQRICPKTLNEARAAIRYELQQASITEEDFSYDLALQYFTELRQKSLARRLRRNMLEGHHSLMDSYADSSFSMHSQVGDYLVESSSKPNAPFIQPRIPRPSNGLASYVHRNEEFEKNERYLEIEDDMVLERFINEDGQHVVVIRGDEQDHRLGQIQDEFDVVEQEYEVPYGEHYAEYNQEEEEKPIPEELPKSSSTSPRRRRVQE